ncbi:hypothetical protein J2S13_000600 [Oikeobacillus pervagus]|uniref:Uncharacterized protein n=1 Tax=Oikeobacillus pervagus TaxID=1325931 RepID=A0AAJ1SX33_9BACI|nr:hypothetical protein [Oikeobacillus pervagus]MDQ0214204.1 hypothetical protein [Oikeobacillus pervagus]
MDCRIINGSIVFNVNTFLLRGIRKIHVVVKRIILKVNNFHRTSYYNLRAIIVYISHKKVTNDHHFRFEMKEV